VCTGCAVTERFALKTKYFYDEQNLKAFREEYAAMPLHEKAMENRLLAGGVWSWRFWRLLSCSRVAASSKSVLKHVVPAQRRRTVSPSRSRICFATSRSIASSTVSSWSSESARTFARTLSRSTSTLSIPSSTAPRTVYSTSNSVANSAIRAVNLFGSPDSEFYCHLDSEWGCERSRICRASVVPVLNGRCSSISVRINS